MQSGKRNYEAWALEKRWVLSIGIWYDSALDQKPRETMTIREFIGGTGYKINILKSIAFM